MFSSRRLAKRSIIGTRVCSTWQDGRYYPGIIQSTQTGPNGDDLFIIRFDDGYTKLALEQDIVGPGFQNVSSCRLKHAQRVFVTHNGREVSGLVLNHDTDLDEVVISIQYSDGTELEVTRRLDEVRLLQSRKSARLQDQDTDYSRLADVHAEPKKRTVSQIIEVPSHNTKRWVCNNFPFLRRYRSKPCLNLMFLNMHCRS